MQVTLEEIKFNHDRTSASADAFNIRRNEREPVHVPEWRAGQSTMPGDSLAAYARDELTSTPTIRAKFSFHDFDAATTHVMIRALDGRLTPRGRSDSCWRRLFRRWFLGALTPNVLGSVVAREINIHGGEEYELFELTNVGINAAGVSVSDIEWRWQFRTASTDWIDFGESTHRIYTVLAKPKSPWQPDLVDLSSTQLPWTAVLDYACSWAGAATHVDDAATLVTKTVHGLGGTLLTYDSVNSGSTSFTLEDPPVVDCTEYLDLLQTGQSTQGSRVNCDDCAAFVVSFANILGCRLNEGRMGVSIFQLKPHQLIGSNNVEEGEFSFHTVGWTGQSQADDELFDACLKLKAEEDPQWFIPTNIRFGQPGEHFYRFRLAKIEEECEPVDANITRTIGDIADTPPPLPVWLKGFLAFLSAGDADLDWKLKEYRLLPSDDSVFIQMFWNNLTQRKAAVRLDLFWTKIPPEDKLKALLKKYQLTAIKPRDKANFGDEVHAVSTNFAIVFRRGNVVVQMRNIGASPAPADDLAKAIDKLLRRTPEIEMSLY
jgi:hypothetical protein